ncbi:hypothetical protein BGW80DRAFT_1395199, partial [Lactifluus volemus]
MFGYILELLNREGPQAFFDLSKGQRVASLALKEKRRLAQKRNRASRQERRQEQVLQDVQDEIKGSIRRDL